jgi:hypothetical protein
MGNDLHALSLEGATSFVGAVNVVDEAADRGIPVEFLDLMVDKQRLRDLLDIPEDLAAVELETTAFRDDWPPVSALEQLDRLLGVLPGDFDDGRIAVFLCPVDGDLWCGSASVEITWTFETVTWHKFGWQHPNAYIERELQLFNDQSFVFDRDQYEHVLRELRHHYASQPNPIYDTDQRARTNKLWSSLRQLRQRLTRH